MSESSIKKGQYITVKRFFFSFFYTKIKKIKIYHIIYILCFMLRDHWKRTHKHFNQKNAPFITLKNLTVNTIRIGIQISFNINGTSKKLHRIKAFDIARVYSHSEGLQPVSYMLLTPAVSTYHMFTAGFVIPLSFSVIFLLENEDSPTSLDQILIFTGGHISPHFFRLQPLAALGAWNATNYLITCTQGADLSTEAVQWLWVIITMAEESLLEKKCLGLCNRQTTVNLAGRVWTE